MGGGGAFFFISAVDGVPEEYNAMRRSIAASRGRGRNMTFVPYARYVPAGKHRLTLAGKIAYAAPIETLLRPSSRWEIIGDVDVDLKPDVTYQAVGVLEPLKREIWLAEYESHAPASTKVVNEEVAVEAGQAMEGAMYTCCNLHYNGDWISDTNASTLPMIPAGSRIVLKDFSGWNRANVLIDAREMRIGHDYGRKQETKEQYVAKLMVKDDPKAKIRTFQPRIQEAIAAGKVCTGMTREQVIIALGYPRTDETSSLDKREWKYWTADGYEYLVVWGQDGLVQKVSGEPEVLGQVQVN